MLTLTLSPEHVAVIMKALVEKPWITVNPILLSIDQQVAEQQAPKLEGAGDANQG